MKRSLERPRPRQGAIVAPVNRAPGGDGPAGSVPVQRKRGAPLQVEPMDLSTKRSKQGLPMPLPMSVSPGPPPLMSVAPMAPLAPTAPAVPAVPAAPAALHSEPLLELELGPGDARTVHLTPEAYALLLSVWQRRSWWERSVLAWMRLQLSAAHQGWAQLLGHPDYGQEKLQADGGDGGQQPRRVG